MKLILSNLVKKQKTIEPAYKGPNVVGYGANGCYECITRTKGINPNSAASVCLESRPNCPTDLTKNSTMYFSGFVGEVRDEGALEKKKVL